MRTTPVIQHQTSRSLLWTLLFLFSAICIAKAARPNVLLIMVDDLNNEVGCHGRKSAITPQIDAFAAMKKLLQGFAADKPSPSVTP